MQEKVALLLKMRACDGLAPGLFGIERRGLQDDVLAIERAIALAD